VIVFTARCNASAVCAVVVCLSVTRQYCIKTAKCRITQATPWTFCNAKHLRENSNGAPKRDGVGSKGDFRPLSRCISETVQDRYMVTRLWNVRPNRNSYALYRLLLFPVTLNGPNYLKPLRFAILYRLSYLHSEWR